LWLDYKDDPELIKVFNNTVEGKVYVEDETSKIDQDMIMEYVEDYLTEKDPFLPNNVLFLSGAVDVHPDRLEVEIDGWGVGEENWVVHYEQLWGDPDQAEVWEQLDELKEKKWKRKDGVELMIGGFIGRRRYYAIVIDSGGYRKNTQSVYNYTRAHQHNGIISIKGRAGQGYPILLNQSMVGKNKDTLLQNVGIDSVKKTIWNRLKYKPGGPRTIHYTYAFCDYKYFEGLFSEPPFTYVEKRTMTYITIFKKRHSGIRNEPWDLKGYNYVAMLLANPNFTELKENLLKQIDKNKDEETVTTEKKKLNMRRVPIRGNFINGWK